MSISDNVRVNMECASDCHGYVPVEMCEWSGNNYVRVNVECASDWLYASGQVIIMCEWTWNVRVG